MRWRIAWVCFGLAIAGGIGWSFAQLTEPSAVTPAASHFVRVKAHSGSVEKSLNLVATATWPSASTATNRLAGVVTTVDFNPGERVSDGQVLYTVDMNPVAVAAGRVPAYRPIGPNDTGQDVEQLQQMLASLGFYDGALDGRFGTETESAVKDWQKSISAQADGVVPLGQVIFVAELPSRVVVDASLVAVGKSLSGGEEAIRTLAAAPDFLLSATDAQSQLLTDKSRVTVKAPGGQLWKGVVTGRQGERSGSGQLLTLSAVGKGPLCATQCGQLGVGAGRDLSARAVVIPRTTGVVVPSAALQSRADEQVFVTEESGREIPVILLAEADGMAAISGVASDAIVRVYTRD